MAPPSERSHLPNPVPYTAGRRSMYSASQAARQTQYSSLGGALGSARQPQYPAGSDYPPPASVSGGSVSQHPHFANYSPSALPSYEYPYQSTTYETSAQYGHSSLPPMRTTSPVAHTAHPTSHYNPPTASYPSSYSQAQYAPIPSVAQQWPEDDWAQPPQSFSPDHLQPMFVAGRSDLAASPQTDTRPYVPPQYASPPGGVRPDEWSAYPSEFSPTSKGKARERELAFSDRSSPPNAFRPISTDYSKLMSTYGQLVGECKEITQQGVLGRPASLDDIECMLRSATLGLQMLQPASSPVAAQNRNPSEDSTAEQGTQSPESPSKRQAENAPAPEGQKCLGCGATSTPEWRRGPLGPRTLCNACGLVYAKLIKKRSQELGPNSIIAPTQPQLHSAPVPAISEEAPSFSSPNNGDSDDDELSYGSQDPH